MPLQALLRRGKEGGLKMYLYDTGTLRAISEHILAQRNTRLRPIMRGFPPDTPPAPAIVEQKKENLELLKKKDLVILRSVC